MWYDHKQLGYKFPMTHMWPKQVQCGPLWWTVCESEINTLLWQLHVTVTGLWRWPCTVHKLHRNRLRGETLQWDPIQVKFIEGRPLPLCFQLVRQSGKESIIRVFSSAEDILKAISWWTVGGLKVQTLGRLPAGHKTAATQERVQLRGQSSKMMSGWRGPLTSPFFLRHLQGTMTCQRLMHLLPGTKAIWKRNAISADVNLLRVRALVHSSVSPPWYYIPVCFSKGSPVTSHLGRDACELWMHCA